LGSKYSRSRSIGLGRPTARMRPPPPCSAYSPTGTKSCFLRVTPLTFAASRPSCRRQPRESGRSERTPCRRRSRRSRGRSPPVRRQARPHADARAAFCSGVPLKRLSTAVSAGPGHGVDATTGLLICCPRHFGYLPAEYGSGSSGDRGRDPVAGAFFEGDIGPLAPMRKDFVGWGTCLGDMDYGPKAPSLFHRGRRGGQ